MEMDVNLSKLSAIELVAADRACHPLHLPRPHYHQHHQHNNNGSAERSLRTLTPIPTTTSTCAPATPTRSGCCGLLGRLLRSSGRGAGKTASSSVGDYASFGAAASAVAVSSISGATAGRRSHHRRTPQEVYFESRGKSCRKLLKFNGSSNKILLYPEEGWARTASSSYWTITPCWWQPNRCRIEEFMGSSQRQSARAKMVSLEQKGSLLIAGSFGGRGSRKDEDEFKLYLSSNISMEDYNMGYCLTGFVERRCRQTNAFQMTHFAVIKRQWPALSSADAKAT